MPLCHRSPIGTISVMPPHNCKILSKDFSISLLVSISTETYSGKVDAVKALQTKLAEMIGEELEVVVMEINKEKNKVILSEKRANSVKNYFEKKENLVKDLPQKK